MVVGDQRHSNCMSDKLPCLNCISWHRRLQCTQHWPVLRQSSLLFSLRLSPPRTCWPNNPLHSNQFNVWWTARQRRVLHLSTHLRKLNFMWSIDGAWEKSIGWQLTDHVFNTICGIQPAIGTLQGTRQTTGWSTPSLKTPRSAPSVSELATNPAVLAIQLGVDLQCQSLVSHKVNTLADICDPSGHFVKKCTRDSGTL